MTETATQPRAVVTHGLVVRSYRSGISSRAPMRYKAHVPACRYAKTADMTMAALVERYGHDETRTKCALGIVEVCKVCDPILLAAPGTEPVVCAYDGVQTDPEVAYYGPNDFVLCDDCARLVREEFATNIGETP